MAPRILSPMPPVAVLMAGAMREVCEGIMCSTRFWICYLVFFTVEHLVRWLVAGLDVQPMLGSEQKIVNSPNRLSVR
jgi:hypothetical protein